MVSVAPDTTTDQVVAGLDALASEDVAALPDEVLRNQLLDLVTVSNRAWAELTRRLEVADRRGLSHDDGFKTAKSWLQAVGRLSGQAAHRLVKAARLLRQLPKLANATRTGDVSPEHVQQVSRLADQVGVEQVAEVDATLADAATQLDPTDFHTVVARVQAHLDPDGPDPAAAFERRGLMLNPATGMLHLHGQLDPEGGAALTTALDAIMTPPGDNDTRTAAQRRADALVDLARIHLAAGDLPTVGGQRPQIGILLYPQALQPALLDKLAAAQQDSFTKQRLQQILDRPHRPPATTPRLSRRRHGHRTGPNPDGPNRPGSTGTDPSATRPRNASPATLT